MWRLVKLEMWNGLGLNAACAAASLPSISNIKDAPVPMSDCAITSGG
jgi:hypothetical protein